MKCIHNAALVSKTLFSRKRETFSNLNEGMGFRNTLKGKQCEGKGGLRRYCKKQMGVKTIKGKIGKG